MRGDEEVSEKDELAALARLRSVTVVIPTLNEASCLPALLDRLAAQTRLPEEIVVADAASTDGTADIARARGLRVVAGGMPAVGRNAGAAVAGGDIIVFMDADAQPEPEFLERALDEFARRRLEVTTAPLRPQTGDHRYWLAYLFCEIYMRALQHVSPHAVGLCIIVTRSLHERIGGFDESLVLAEDHDYARRAARLGRFGILRGVKSRTSMRRVHEQGKRQLARVLIYSELRTLAGIPIQSLPFPYAFGAFDGEPQPDGGREPRHRAREVLRTLRKPSSEIQGDAIGLQVASAVAGGLGTAALASTGADPATYLSVAGVAAVAAGASTYEALRKLRYERPYGEYVSSSVAVASDDISDALGRSIVRAGIDEICEVHAIRNVDKMAKLTKQGLGGRLQVILDGLEGIRAMSLDMDDPFYDKVTYLTARSDLTNLLFNLGFSEVANPPRYDLINRVEKRVLMWRLGRQTGHKRDGDSEKYRMAIMSKADFASPDFLGRIDARIARTRRDLQRAGAAVARAGRDGDS